MQITTQQPRKSPTQRMKRPAQIAGLGKPQTPAPGPNDRDTSLAVALTRYVCTPRLQAPRRTKLTPAYSRFIQAPTHTSPVRHANSGDDAKNIGPAPCLDLLRRV